MIEGLKFELTRISLIYAIHEKDFSHEKYKNLSRDEIIYLTYLSKRKIVWNFLPEQMPTNISDW